MAVPPTYSYDIGICSTCGAYINTVNGMARVKHDEFHQHLDTLGVEIHMLQEKLHRILNALDAEGMKMSDLIGHIEANDSHRGASRFGPG